MARADGRFVVITANGKRVEVRHHQCRILQRENGRQHAQRQVPGHRYPGGAPPRPQGRGPRAASLGGCGTSGIGRILGHDGEDRGMDLTITREQHRRMHEILASVFGLTSFRPYQEDIIARVLNGQSLLAVLSTGAGKSLCYQLPSLLLKRPTLVVSPLVALMKDQVDRLKARGISAGAVSHGDLPESRRLLAQQWQRGSLMLLYVAPERLAQEKFVRWMRMFPPGLLVIDEAHCISEWGYDFRPDYRRIRRFRDDIGKPPVLALTATATPQVTADIFHHLGMDKEQSSLVKGDVDRPNLFLTAEMAPNVAVQTRRVASLAEKAEGAVLVYADSRQRVEEWARMLAAALKEPVAYYHAGLGRTERTKTQDAFLKGHSRVVVATNAFGMGIDRGDIAAVIHVGVPESLDAYYQEIGRAGRDGQPATVALIVRPADIRRRQALIRREAPSGDAVTAILSQLNDMADGELGVWRQHAEWPQMPVVLSLLEEMGLVEVIDRGVDDLKIRRRQAAGPAVLDAVMARLNEQHRWRQARWRAMEQYVASSVCRRQQLLAYYGWPPTAKTPGSRCCDNCRDHPQELSVPVAGLDHILREWRRAQAHQEGVPSYRVLSDRDIAEIVQKRPRTEEELSRCRGIGPVKLARYGHVLCRLVREACPPPFSVAGTPWTATSRDQAWRLFQDGVTFSEVVRQTGRSEATVRRYLVEWIRSEPEDQWRWYVSRLIVPDVLDEIVRALRKVGSNRLRRVYEFLDGRFSYGQLEIARAVGQRTGALTG